MVLREKISRILPQRSNSTQLDRCARQLMNVVGLLFDKSIQEPKYGCSETFEITKDNHDGMVFSSPESRTQQKTATRKHVRSSTIPTVACKKLHESSEKTRKLVFVGTVNENK